jgi:WD40 repeat protein
MKYVPVDVTTFADSMNRQHKDQKVKLTLLASIELKQGEGDVMEPLYTGLDFLPDGRLVAVDNYNKKCLVYNQKLEKMGFVLLPDNPRDVTVMNDEDTAVSSGPKIYFIKISKSSDATVTRTLKVAMNCYSICMMSDDSFLVGCYDDPQPIRVISVKGEERALAINIPSKQYKRDESTCAYIKNPNKVVLSEKFAHTVYIYDIANNTGVEVKDEKIIKEPRGMAVGPADCIFVCCTLANSILQISHTGQLLSSHVLDMKYPRSVCVSKDNTRLAVSNSAIGKIKLQVFNIEGI